MINIDRKIYMPYKFILKFIISGTLLESYASYNVEKYQSLWTELKPAKNPKSNFVLNIIIKY